jgi:hypothetical protein
MTCAYAALDANFKACCMASGRHDGVNRKHYFQGLMVLLVERGVSKKIRHSGICLLAQARNPYARQQ